MEEPSPNRHQPAYRGVEFIVHQDLVILTGTRQLTRGIGKPAVDCFLRIGLPQPQSARQFLHRNTHKHRGIDGSAIANLAKSLNINRQNGRLAFPGIRLHGLNHGSIPVAVDLGVFQESPGSNLPLKLFRLEKVIVDTLDLTWAWRPRCG